MNNLLNRIEELENKRDNNTITMEEDALLIKLIDLGEKFIYSK